MGLKIKNETCKIEKKKQATGYDQKPVKYSAGCIKESGGYYVFFHGCKNLRLNKNRCLVCLLFGAVVVWFSWVQIYDFFRSRILSIKIFSHFSISTFGPQDLRTSGPQAHHLAHHLAHHYIYESPFTCVDD